MVDRQFILDEIRRLTTDNAGEPIGQIRFSKETGIRPSDWQGKFWAKWGDALIDAGFSPNSFNNAYEDRVIFLRYIEVLRSLAGFQQNTSYSSPRRIPRTFHQIVYLDGLVRKPN